MADSGHSVASMVCDWPVLVRRGNALGCPRPVPHASVGTSRWLAAKAVRDGGSGDVEPFVAQEVPDATSVVALELDHIVFDSPSTGEL